MELTEAIETVATWRQEGPEAGFRYFTPHTRHAIDTLVEHARRGTQATIQAEPATPDAGFDHVMKVTGEIRTVRGALREIRSAHSYHNRDFDLTTGPLADVYERLTLHLAVLQRELLEVQS